MYVDDRNNDYKNSNQIIKKTLVDIIKDNKIMEIKLFAISTQENKEIC